MLDPAGPAPTTITSASSSAALRTPSEEETLRGTPEGSALRCAAAGSVTGPVLSYMLDGLGVWGLRSFVNLFTNLSARSLTPFHPTVSARSRYWRVTRSAIT
ncbi:hypothetical protein GCM10023259_077300 [Thermocatellispora tengchongensis]